ncbi:MAG: Unknown protein [uncultured Thiotrichaceae bacterium]|uniref:Uncharacterized protein n=1 Tax=uncultured Thiotrichaceae bacterium TaxID=298394 RepID=A0A6S6U546_9GAMM|nr:MAG: Unknown protein [uncultured Thiotrichaceae bacterium]
MHKASNILIRGLLVITTVLWLTSYTRHTAIGIDHDVEQQDRILHKYYRTNWTGHGSIWIGYGSLIKPDDSSQLLEKFDLAAAFFHRKYISLEGKSQTGWNKLGFWYINSSEPRPVFWIGIPSWLPVQLLVLLLFAQKKYLVLRENN